MLRDFMEQMSEKYYKDITGRRNAPKGNVILTEDVTRNRDYIRFTPIRPHVAKPMRWWNM
ncbi:hypothetical protein [Paraflavitalea speifideaquila]|uniref:hypothetical protein n=1 Tax=Paraflavitalea speifideaquila TaxID=3076558 RepID=UPI0028E9C947|nr:hypothetical protein [Paraflavitalea speifideiaquila]